MARPKMPPGFGKPTMETRFYIDYTWWDKSDKDIDLHIEQLCEDYGQAITADDKSDEEVEWIDPFTGEVQLVSQNKYRFLTQCAAHPDFITERTTLIEAIFRALLAADNKPMTPEELAERIGRPAETILRTLSGRRVYNGIRPYTGAEEA